MRSIGGPPKSFSDLVLGISRRSARSLPFRPTFLRLERPIVSFSFDDFPLSAKQNAAPILEAAGMRGTFYYCTGLAGLEENGQAIATTDDVVDLYRRGHEIGGHTHGHIDVHTTPRAELLADVDQNNGEIAALTGGQGPESFAYPYGRLDLRSKFLLMRKFGGLRGIQSGVNSGLVDLANLKAQELYRTSTLESLGLLLDRLEIRPGWLIFYTHDVKPDSTNIGCSPEHFAATVQMVKERGFDVMTVADALRAMRHGARPNKMPRISKAF